MLTKFWRTPEEENAEAQIIFARNQKHWNEINESFPDAVQGCTLCMSQIGPTLIRAFIECPKDISEEDTRIIMDWQRKLSGKIERGFREENGTFYWSAKKDKIKDENGEYDFMILVEKTNPLGCEIVSVKKEVEVFESVCK